MNRAQLFMNGGSQAVRLPKEFRFQETEVYINRIDDMVVIFPRKKAWETLALSLEKFTSDYLSERQQPLQDEREGIL